MLAMNLVDSLDAATNYGILICNNENVTCDLIQDKIIEIKNGFGSDGVDWVIDDVIGFLPKDWLVSLQKITKDKVEI